MKKTLICPMFALTAALLVAGCSAEAKKTRTLERAGNYFASGKYEEAKVEYMKLLRDDPHSTVVNERLGLIWFEQGAPFRALPFLINTRRLAPESPSVRTKLASALVSAERIDEARAEALSAVRAALSHEDALLVLSETVRNPAEYEATLAEIRKSPVANRPLARVAYANVQMLTGDLNGAEKSLNDALRQDSKCHEAHIARGNLELRRGNSEKATDHFRAGAEAAPARSLSRIRYAEHLVQSGSVPAAKSYLAKMLVDAPDYLPPRQVLARIAIQERRFEEAGAAVTEIFYRDPLSVDANLLQASIQVAKGEAGKALERLQELEKANPGLPVVAVSHAKLLLRQAKADQALAVLTASMTRNPEHIDSSLLFAEINLRSGKPAVAGQALAQLLKRHPQCVPAQSLLIAALRATSRFDEAASVAREQIRLMPKSPEPQLLLGGILKQQGKNPEALAAFDKAIELAPRYVPAVVAAVDLQLGEKNFEEALKRVAEFKERVPNSADASVLEATVHITQKNWDRADAALQEALRINPDNARAYSLLAATYAQSKRAPQVLTQLESILAANPSNLQALVLSAVVQGEMGEHQKAKEAYEKILLAKPDFSLALNNLAYLCAEKLNDLDRAYQLASKARELDPNSPMVADTLGWVLFKRKDYVRALELIQESASKLPDNPEIQQHLTLATQMVAAKK